MSERLEIRVVVTRGTLDPADWGVARKLLRQRMPHAMIDALAICLPDHGRSVPRYRGDCNVPEAERVPGKCAWLPPFEAGSFLSRGGAAGQSGGGERFSAELL